MDSNPAKRRKTDHSVLDAFALDAESAAAGIFRPSTFLLETAELLRQSRVDYGKLLPDSEELLRTVKSAVEAVETHGPIPISKASVDFEDKSSIRIPYPSPRPAADSLLKLSMEKPAHCNVVGSFVLKTMVRSQREFAVDMIVEMPRSLFQDKDYLNLRYFYKRAYYLAHIAKAVGKALPDALRLSFAYLGDNPLLPVLVATPTAGKGPAACKIRILPCLDNVFARQKLLANRNCLRLDASAETKDLPATPFYNATVKADAAYLAYLKLLHQTQKACPAFVDACLLGRVWLQQRGFGGSMAHGGFGAFEWAALVALLMQTDSKKKAAGTILSPSLSSTQIFKAVIQFLSSADLRGKPFILGGAAPEAGIDALREGVPVLYDAVRQLNLGYKMSLWSAALLRQYARQTHELLKDDSAADQFALTFITKANVALEAFDMVFRVYGPSETGQSSIDRRGRVWEFGSSVFQTLKKAMGDRARLVHVQLPASEEWPLDEAVVQEADDGAFPSSLTVGVVFDPVHMARQVDHGPSAEEKKEARKFREFWGERAELRRFKDGSIQETLVWTAQGAGALCEEIARYILGLRLGLTDADDVEVVGGGFARQVPLRTASDATAFAAARAAFATLEQDIRGLEELPLHVRQVSAIAPELRAASLRAPAVQTERAPLYPMEAVLYFEASGKWPDSLVAIQQAKTAFLLRIGDALAGLRAGIETQLGLEDTRLASENQAFLDIVYADVAAFRLRIYNEPEAALLERQTRDRTLEQHARTASANLLAANRRLFGHLPLHNQIVGTFCTRFPALSPTIRLVKRWFGAHKLASHFREECIELIVLHVFLRPHPWQTPGSATPGLLRTLQFLARWDWRAEPLVLDTSELSADGAAQEATGAGGEGGDPRTRLEAWRKIDPNMHHTVLFVAATHESSGTAFTTATHGASSRPLPSRVVAGRMTSLARAACRLVKDHDAAADPAAVLDARLLFAPALADYDVLIHLSPRVVALLERGEAPVVDADGSVHSKRRSIFKNLDGRTGHALGPLPAHPVQVFLDQLHEAYGCGSSAPIVFFHGSCEADDHVIGALWNPLLPPRPFRVNLPCSFQPACSKGTDADMVEVNREGILAEIARIGGGLVERIEVKG